jgi:GNAT superfamily N-acetyltransferase
MALSKPVLHLDPAASSRALAERLEAAHQQCVLRYTQSVIRMRPAAGATWKAIAGGLLLYSGRSPLTVGVGVALKGPVAATELAEIEDFFRSRGAPSALEVSPYTHASLPELLQAHGYRVGDMSTVLCRDLLHAPELQSSIPPQVRVHWAEAHEIGLWVNTMIRLFYVSEPGGETRANLEALFCVAGSLNAIAEFAGEVAGIAGGMLPAPGDIAALFYSCTLPQFRRRGIHSVLLHFRLQRAREHGCQFAVATALPGSDSERNLQRHGFAPLYEKQTYIKNFNS